MSQPPKRPGPPASPPPSQTSSFSVEDPSSISEMPSVTRLLNRSRFGLERTQTKTQNPSLPPLLKTEELLPPPPVKAPPTPPPSLKKPPALDLSPSEGATAFPPAPVKSAPSFTPSGPGNAGSGDAPTLEVLHTPEAEGSAVPESIKINEISLATDTRFLKTGEISPAATESVEVSPPQSHRSSEPAEIAIAIEVPQETLTTPESAQATATPPTPDEKPVASAPGASASGGISEIRPSARSLARHQGFVPARLWTFDELKFGADPLGKGMASIQESGKAHGMGFLHSRPGSPRPTFDSFAVTGSQADRFAWLSGMTWDSLALPDLWSAFLKAGVLEVSPPPNSPQKVSSQSQARLLARKLFGATGDETLTLVRVGTKAATRGVLVVLSKGSVLEEINASMIDFQSDGPEHSQLFALESASSGDVSPISDPVDNTPGEIQIELAA